MFFKVNPGHPHENTSNFKKYILRLSRVYHQPSNLERTLSLRSLKRNLSPRTRNKTIKIKNLEEDLEKDQLN